MFDNVFMSMPESNQCKHLIDVAFIDDEAVALGANTPNVLYLQLARVMEVFAQVFSKYLMQFYLAKSKTEAIINYRGREAKTCQSRLLDSRQEDGASLAELA